MQEAAVGILIVLEVVEEEDGRRDGLEGGLDVLAESLFRLLWRQASRPGDAKPFRDRVQKGACGEHAAGVEDEDVRTLPAAPLQEAGGEGGLADAAQAVDDEEPFAVVERLAEAALGVAAADVPLVEIGDTRDFEGRALDFEGRLDPGSAPFWSGERPRVLPHGEGGDRPLMRTADRRQLGTPGA